MPSKLPGPKNWIRQAEYAGPSGKIGTARSRHALDILDKSAEYTEYHIKGVAKNESRLSYKNHRTSGRKQLTDRETELKQKMHEVATNTSPVPSKVVTPTKQVSPVELTAASPAQSLTKAISPAGSKKSVASPLGSARVAVTPSGRPIAPTPNKEPRVKINEDAKMEEEKIPSPPLSPATRASVCRNL
ncbi:DgyrCDS2513 [Dimorphilus gyrociliatus]|nr:DgyrCDS2513 [Dimorphilus gyrociliatus]